MSALYTTIFYQPIFNLLVWVYGLVDGNMAVAIVVLTVIIKLILYPLSQQSLRSQRALQQLQPQLEELKTKHRDDKEQLTRAMMELYRREKVNPFSSCLPLLIQLPFLIAVFQVFRGGLNSDSFNLLYPFVVNPGHLNAIVFSSIDLSKPLWVVGVLAGLVQYWQTKMLMSKKSPVVGGGAKNEALASAMNRQMLYFMPVLTVVFGFSLPAGLMLYWFVNTLLTIGQQYLILRQKLNPPISAST